MGQNRPSPPSKYAVALYWMKQEPQFVPDIGEPECFACGYWHEDWGKGRSLNSIWSSTKGLELCHIVPYSLDGSAAPENFLLLCTDCHRKAPDYKNPALMLTWAKQRCFADDFSRALKTVLDSGIKPGELDNIDLLGKDCLSFIKEHVTPVPRKDREAFITAVIAALFEYSAQRNGVLA